MLPGSSPTLGERRVAERPTTATASQHGRSGPVDARVDNSNDAPRGGQPALEAVVVGGGGGSSWSEGDRSSASSEGVRRRSSSAGGHGRRGDESSASDRPAAVSRVVVAAPPPSMLEQPDDDAAARLGVRLALRGLRVDAATLLGLLRPLLTGFDKDVGQLRHWDGGGGGVGGLGDPATSGGGVGDLLWQRWYVSEMQLTGRDAVLHDLAGCLRIDVGRLAQAKSAVDCLASSSRAGGGSGSTTAAAAAGTYPPRRRGPSDRLGHAAGKVLFLGGLAVGLARRVDKELDACRDLVGDLECLVKLLDPGEGDNAFLRAAGEGEEQDRAGAERGGGNESGSEQGYDEDCGLNGAWQ